MNFILFLWLLENLELYMWLAFVAYITFLLDCATINHYSAIVTIIIVATFIEHLTMLC